MSSEIPSKDPVGQQLRAAWQRHNAEGGVAPIRVSGDFLEVQQRLADLALPGTSYDVISRVAHASEAARFQVESESIDFTKVTPEDFTSE